MKSLLIFNPHAGSKKLSSKLGLATGIDEIKALLTRYQFDFDSKATEYPKHASVLAKEAVLKKYDQVIVCGGDGTVNEVAQALVDTKLTLGIIPMGTYMNTASMLSIPFNTEQAVMVLKMQRTRKIDVGCVMAISGKKLPNPYYFLETSGIGLDAELQKIFLEIERGKFWKIITALQTFAAFYTKSVFVDIDGEEIKVSSTLVNVSNGPYTGARIKLAPEAKLNDHKLTVALVRMSKWELFLYFLKLGRLSSRKERKITTYQGEKVKIRSSYPRPVHADATLFGVTPVEYEIKPNALTVICGFPPPDEEAHLVKKTPMDPRS